MNKHQKIALTYSTPIFNFYIPPPPQKKPGGIREVFFDVFREHRKNTGMKQTDIDVLRFFNESYSSLIVEKVIIFVTTVT